MSAMHDFSFDERVAPFRQGGGKTYQKILNKISEFYLCAEAIPTLSRRVLRPTMRKMDKLETKERAEKYAVAAEDMAAGKFSPREMRIERRANCLIVLSVLLRHTEWKMNNAVVQKKLAYIRRVTNMNRRTIDRVIADLRAAGILKTVNRMRRYNRKGESGFAAIRRFDGAFFRLLRVDKMIDYVSGKKTEIAAAAKNAADELKRAARMNFLQLNPMEDSGMVAMGKIMQGWEK